MSEIVTQNSNLFLVPYDWSKGKATYIASPLPEGRGAVLVEVINRIADAILVVLAAIVALVATPIGLLIQKCSPPCLIEKPLEQRLQDGKVGAKIEVPGGGHVIKVKDDGNCAFYSAVECYKAIHSECPYTAEQLRDKVIEKVETVQKEEIEEFNWHIFNNNSGADEFIERIKDHSKAVPLSLIKYIAGILDCPIHLHRLEEKVRIEKYNENSSNPPLHFLYNRSHLDPLFNVPQA